MFQSPIVCEQLELLKPPAPGPKKDPNLPLLLSTVILLLGLLLVFTNLTEKKTSLAIKCVGPCFVMSGVSVLLVRVLFSSSPTVWINKKKAIQEVKRKKEIESTE